MIVYNEPFECNMGLYVVVVHTTRVTYRPSLISYLIFVCLHFIGKVGQHYEVKHGMSLRSKKRRSLQNKDVVSVYLSML